MKFKNNTILKSVDGKKIVVGKLLASGGQGEVYLVDYDGQQMALKWFIHLGLYPEKLLNNLTRNIKKKSPSSAFLWPVDLVYENSTSFGYIMPLRPKGYEELSKFMMNNGPRFSSFKAIASACIKVSNAFRLLHREGLVYQDLNDGAFFINPDTGDVKICDIDNISPNNQDVGILGKPRYVAPEIVLRKSFPNKFTDRFSLAIILYFICFNQHPFEGKKWASEPCLTDEVNKEIYGHPVFLLIN